MRTHTHKVNGPLILSAEDRVRFSKKGAPKKLDKGSEGSFNCWVDLQAAVELTMAALGAAVSCPSCPGDVWIRCEIPVQGV